jgi:hypothetical protein
MTINQSGDLNELHTSRGHYDTDPLEDFFYFVTKKLSKKEKEVALKSFVKKVFPDVRLDDSIDIIDVFDVLTERDPYLPKFLTDRKNRNYFAYYIAKKFFDLKDGFELQYFIQKNGTEDEYYFFDKTLKLFVGRLSVSKNKDFKGKSYTVVVSSVDKGLIGLGYGIRMYLTILQNVDYLQSDTLLFSGSLRVWRDSLPKYVNVWGIYQKGPITKFEQVEPGERYKSRKYDNFIASAYHEKPVIKNLNPYR